MELGLVSKFYSILIHFIWFNMDLIRFDALISQFCSILITFASDLICFDAMNYCWVSTLISRIIVFGIHEVNKIWSDSQGWFNWSWDKKILFNNIKFQMYTTLGKMQLLQCISYSFCGGYLHFVYGFVDQNRIMKCNVFNIFICSISWFSKIHCVH